MWLSLQFREINSEALRESRVRLVVLKTYFHHCDKGSIFTDYKKDYLPFSLNPNKKKKKKQSFTFLVALASKDGCIYFTCCLQTLRYVQKLPDWTVWDIFKCKECNSSLQLF